MSYVVYHTYEVKSSIPACSNGTSKTYNPAESSTWNYHLQLTISPDAQMPDNNASESLVADPLPTMFTQYQQRYINKGCKRISYPREYKLAAIQRVRSGKSRYRVARELNITESMIGKWMIASSKILAMKKSGRRAVSGRQAKFPLLEGLL